MKKLPEKIIFGLADHPRPENSGYFYYKPSTWFGNFKIKTLVVLDLSITDKTYLTAIITKGINRLLEKKKFKNNMEYFLTTYETENIKPFVEEILRTVIKRRLNQ